MATKRHNDSIPDGGAPKKSSTMTLTSYAHGCDEKPDIFFLAGEEGGIQVIFPAHTAKFKALPDGCVLRRFDDMASAEPISLPAGVTADGYCNLLCVLYGTDMALTPDTWHRSFVTYVKLTMMETEFEEQLLDFMTRQKSPDMALACLGTCLEYNLYDSPFEEICWKHILHDGDATFKSPNFMDISWALLLRILKRDSLRVSREIAVYDAAVAWATESLKRKSVECTHAAIREELGEALFQIRFTRMPLVNFAVGPGTTEILTDKEKADICLSRFNKDFTAQGFSFRKRVAIKTQNPSVVEGCVLCGHSEDAFVECCEMYLRVPKKAWSQAYCTQKMEYDDECEGVAYRCECDAVNFEREKARATECEECGLGVHYCSHGVQPLSKFREGQRREWCGEVPVYGADEE